MAAAQRRFTKSRLPVVAVTAIHPRTVTVAVGSLE